MRTHRRRGLPWIAVVVVLAGAAGAACGVSPSPIAASTSSCSSPRRWSATKTSRTSRPSTEVIGSEPPGTVMTTRAGEISVKVEHLVLLAKALRPLPSKWHGLADPDIRYRQRYADLAVNAHLDGSSRSVMPSVASFRNIARPWFVEVETPIFHVEPGGAHARPFVTHHNTLDLPLYLRVATELHLKRLIVGGFDRVFQIGKTFATRGGRHQTPNSRRWSRTRRSATSPT